LEVQWSHVQHWFLHAYRNKALRSKVEHLFERGTAAQQLHGKLKRQLADAESEVAQLQQLVDVTEQAQQQVAALAEQLRLHGDAEELAVREAEKQLQRLMLTHQQQADTVEQQQHCGVQNSCRLAEGEAATILEQLYMLGICAAEGDAQESDASKWLALLQQVQQLQANNAEQFKQCMLANYQLQHLQQCAP
jgi:hypothetical protein